MSYSFPCKSLLKLAPIILLTATLAAVITSLALRSYTPYDASSRDFHAIFNNYLSKARYVPTDYCKASNSLGCVDGQPVW